MAARVVAKGLAVLVLVSVAATPPAAAQQEAPFRPALAVGVGAGSGSLHLDCAECGIWSGSQAAVMELEAGVDVSRSMRLLLVTGTSWGDSGDLSATVGWTLVGVRFRPPHAGGLFLEGAVGQAAGTLTQEKPAQPVCAADDLGCAYVLWGLLLGLPELLNGPTHERVARFTTPAGQLGAGFDLGLGRGWSFTPQLRLGLGRATVSGYSIGVQKRFALPGVGRRG
jgi:hypothetical protein